MPLKLEDLTPVERGAVALLATGRGTAREILRALPGASVEKLVAAIAGLPDVPADLAEQVLRECDRISRGRGEALKGGLDSARGLLTEALGETGAAEILGRLSVAEGRGGFRKLHRVDSRQLVDFLQSEHPQTVALILSQLNPMLAASVISELPHEMQTDVSLRIATMERISPDVLSQVEAVLDEQFDATAENEVSVAGGAGHVAEILNLVDRSTEHQILQSMDDREPGLALEIRNLMFAFEDIGHLDDRSIQNLLKEIGTSDLAVALKASSEELQRRIFSNVSERVASLIREEMEFTGPLRLSEVEARQQVIIDVVRRLEDEGQVVLAGRGDKEQVII